MNQPSRAAAAAGARAGAPPTTARRGGVGRPQICGAPRASSGGAPPAAGLLCDGNWGRCTYGGTFFFFRSEMDPLNTLWLAPVGSAMVAAPLFRYQPGQPRRWM